MNFKLQAILLVILAALISLGQAGVSSWVSCENHQCWGQCGNNGGSCMLGSTWGLADSCQSNSDCNAAANCVSTCP